MSNQFKFTAFTLTNILVVEDHRVVQVGIRMLLEDSGIKYTIKYASNFPKAIEILSNHTIDLVILDLNVPGGNNTKMIEILLANAHSTLTRKQSITITKQSLNFRNRNEHIMLRRNAPCFPAEAWKE